jgi:hypothetical protein
MKKLVSIPSSSGFLTNTLKAFDPDATTLGGLNPIFIWVSHQRPGMHAEPARVRPGLNPIFIWVSHQQQAIECYRNASATVSIPSSSGFLTNRRARNTYPRRHLGIEFP